MNKPKPTRTLLKQVIAKCDLRITSYEGDSNPQVKKLLIRAKAEKEAFLAVLDHLRGDSCMLNIYAES